MVPLSLFPIFQRSIKTGPLSGPYHYIRLKDIYNHISVIRLYSDLILRMLGYNTQFWTDAICTPAHLFAELNILAKKIKHVQK